MSNFDARFMKDEELHDLLEHWSVPDAPPSLDNRVAAAYNNLMGDAVGSNSPLYPQRDSEVVKMKFCDTCQEQFADRFSFCPVDGTPLSAVPATPVSTSARDLETSYPVAESTVSKPIVGEPAYAAIPATAAASSAAIFGEFHLTILEDRGLLYRLASELGGVAHNYRLTWPEFKRDPFGFVKRSIQGYGQMLGGVFGSRNILVAMFFSVVAIVAIIGMVVFLDRQQSAGVSRKPLIVIALLGFCGLLAIFSTWLRRDRDSGVMGTRPTDSRNALS